MTYRLDSPLSYYRQGQHELSEDVECKILDGFTKIKKLLLFIIANFISTKHIEGHCKTQQANI